MVTQDRWTLTAEENAIDSLEVAVRQLMEIDVNPWAWKWVCIGLHDALYGFAVCAAADSNPTNVENSNGRLKDFWDILKMVQDPNCMSRYSHSKTLELNPQLKTAIDLLKKALRNPLAHFKPSVWGIDLDGLPEMVCGALDVIEFLAVDSGNVMTSAGRLHYNRIRGLCEAGRNFAQNSLVKQQAKRDAEEIESLKFQAPAIEVSTTGDGLPSSIGKEIIALKNHMTLSEVRILKCEPPQEPNFHTLAVTVIGAVPYPRIEEVMKLIANRAPAQQEPWDDLTSAITIWDLDRNVNFRLPEKYDEALAHFKKHLPSKEKPK